MANEFDRRIMPDFLQTTLAISLGAAYKGFQSMLNPTDTIATMVTETRSMFTVPEDAGEGVSNKIQALAGVWVQKGTTMVLDLKSAGEKFSEGK